MIPLAENRSLINKTMTIKSTIKRSLEKFDEEYGVKHYQVCEGEKCVCRKVLKVFLLQSQLDLLEAVIKEFGMFDDGCGCCSNTTLGKELGYELSEIKQQFNK